MPDIHSQPFLRDPLEIAAWLATYCDIKGSVTIREDGQVEVHGSVIFNAAAKRNLTHFRVQFATVSDTFDCDSLRELTSLRGAPRTVGGDFTCSFCETLRNLAGAPIEVGGTCYCSFCSNLESLEGAPKIVKGSFSCAASISLKTLQGAPQHVGYNFLCENCDNLISLEGGPPTIGGMFWCRGCPNLRSIKGLPARIPLGLDVRDSGILDITDIRNVSGMLHFDSMDEPTPAFVAQLIHNRTQLYTQQRQVWVDLVNAYHQTGDILATISAFEAYFKVPFHDTISPSPFDLDVPSL